MAVRELGADRVIYGSDAGGRSFASQLAKVQGADVPDDAKKKILGENLKRLLTPDPQGQGDEAVTEAEWLVAKIPYPMFDFLGRTVSPRKLRLFGIACCRRLRSLMANDECREAVVLAERLVEGEVAPKKLPGFVIS